MLKSMIARLWHKSSPEAFVFKCQVLSRVATDVVKKGGPETDVTSFTSPLGLYTTRARTVPDMLAACAIGG